MNVNSEPASLIVKPFSFKLITISKGYFAFAINLIALPVALVDAVVGKSLYAFSLSFSKDPLSEIGCS